MKANLLYGIEAFFAPKAKALQMQKERNTGRMALLMVTQDGKAALKTVVPP